MSARTVNQDLSVLCDCLEWALEQGMINKNPFRWMRQLRKPRQVVPYISQEEIDPVFDALPAKHRSFFTFLRETGCRHEEALAPRRSQINLKRKEVLFLRTKFSRDRAVPLSPKAIEAIQTVPPSPFYDHAFDNPDTLKRWSDCRKPWESARKQAGSKLRVHDLRHFYAIRLAEKGVPMHYIQYMLGHSSVTTTEKYYARFSPRSAQQAVLAILEGGRG